MSTTATTEARATTTTVPGASPTGTGGTSGTGTETTTVSSSASETRSDEASSARLETTAGGVRPATSGAGDARTTTTTVPGASPTGAGGTSGTGARATAGDARTTTGGEPSTRTTTTSIPGTSPAEDSSTRPETAAENRGTGETVPTTAEIMPAVEESKTEEETKYINGVDVNKLKLELAKIKTDIGYDVLLDETTGKITVTIPSDGKYDAEKIKSTLKPYIENGKNAEITISKQKTVNLDKLKSTFSANGARSNVKLAQMKEQLLHKIPNLGDFQRIHTKALIERLADIDEDDDIFHNLATSLNIGYNDKEDILQYMRNNIDTEEVRTALAELNYNNKNLFNSEKQNLENELKTRGVTRKELGKLSDEEIADTRNLNKIQQTLNHSEQQIKQEMKEIKKKVREGWFGWIRDLLGCYGSEYEAQEKLLQKMKEQKKQVQENIVQSAAHANKIFADKVKSRQSSSTFIEQHQDGLVNSKKKNISTNINLLGISSTDQNYAPSSGTEGIEKQQEGALQI